MENDKKKKIVIIGLIVLFLLLGIIIFFKGTPVTPQDPNSQLLSDIALLAPRDGTIDTNRSVAPILTVSADVPAVAPGQPSVISWTSPNAESCVDGNGNALSTSGSVSVTPNENYTLDVVCTNTKGTTIESATVTVTTAPIITLSANPKAVRVGEQSIISWRTANTDRCTDPAGKTLRLNDSFSVKIQKPYTFSISCTGPKGSGKNSVTVAIDSSKAPTRTTQPVQTTTFTPAPTATYTTPKTTTPPKTTTTIKTAPAGSATITLTASKSVVAYGEPSVISWRTLNAKNCVGMTNTGVEILNNTNGDTSLFLMPLYQPLPKPLPLPSNGDMGIRVLDGHSIATLIVRCENTDGTITERSITVTSKPAAPDACLNVRPRVNLIPSTSITIANGTTAIVSWGSACATRCSLRSTGGGEAITYPSQDFYNSVAMLDTSTDYNTYVPIPKSLIGVEKSGGVRVPPGKITVSCTNDNATTPLTLVKSIDISYPPAPDDCDWFCGIIDIVVIVAIVAVAYYYGPAALDFVAGATPAAAAVPAAAPSSVPGGATLLSASVSDAVTGLLPGTLLGSAILLTSVFAVVLAIYAIYKKINKKEGGK